jgi:hypothetical protein
MGAGPRGFDGPVEATDGLAERVGPLEERGSLLRALEGPMEAVGHGSGPRRRSGRQWFGSGRRLDKEIGHAVGLALQRVGGAANGELGLDK